MAEKLQAPPSKVKPRMSPWEVITWVPEKQNTMFANWAGYHTKKQNFRHGMNYINKALEIRPDDPYNIMGRSEILRLTGEASTALADARRAKEIFDDRNVVDAKVDLMIIDALYNANHFENSRQTLHDKLELYGNGAKSVPLLNRLHVINENFDDTLSDKYAFAVRNLIMNYMSSIYNGAKRVESECDVVSIPEKEVEVLSPLEEARRRRAYKIYLQSYVNNNWIDVLFLKSMRKNPNLLLKQSHESTPELRKLTNEKYRAVRNMTKILYSRCPEYSKHVQKFPNEELYMSCKTDNLYRIQYQTRRNMFKILKSIRHMISLGEIKKLGDFIEDVMGDYVTIKTNRIMPWKFEFMNEVYNYLGLARIHQYRIPREMKVLAGPQRLLKLFRVPIDKVTDSSGRNAFGLPSAKVDFVDPRSIILKKRIARLEKRMLFAKIPLERSYLLHEIAQAHLDNNSFDAACSVARKSINEAKQCQSRVWNFLSLMIICKAHAILGKIERESSSLKKAFELAQAMKNIDLCIFIDICLKVSSEERDLNRAMLAFEANKRRLKSNSMDMSFEGTSTP